MKSKLIVMFLMSLNILATNLETTIINGKEIPAAVLIYSDRYGEKNLSDYDYVMQDAEVMCYKGNVNDALFIAKALQENLWLNEGQQMDDIVNENGVIIFKVLENINTSKVDTSEYIITPCE